MEAILPGVLGRVPQALFSQDVKHVVRNLARMEPTPLYLSQGNENRLLEQGTGRKGIADCSIVHLSQRGGSIARVGQGVTGPCW